MKVMIKYIKNVDEMKCGSSIEKNEMQSCMDFSCIIFFQYSKDSFACQPQSSTIEHCMTHCESRFDYQSVYVNALVSFSAVYLTKPSQTIKSNVLFELTIVFNV